MVAMSVLMWIVAAVLLVAAAMLVWGVGEAGLWVAVIAVRDRGGCRGAGASASRVLAG